MVLALFDHPTPWVVLAWLLASLDICRRYMNSYDLQVSNGFGSIALIFLGTTLAVTLPIPLLRKLVSAAERILEKWAWDFVWKISVVAFFIGIFFMLSLVDFKNDGKHLQDYLYIPFVVPFVVCAYAGLRYLSSRLLLWLRDVARNPVPWFLPAWLVSGTVASSFYIYSGQAFRHESNEGLARFVLLVLAVAAFATFSALQWLRLALHQQD